MAPQDKKQTSPDKAVKTARARRVVQKKKVVCSAAGFSVPRPTDVLLGRGGEGNHHAGNQNYQKKIASWSRRYLQCQGRKQKTEVSWKVYEEMSSSGTRFLKKDKVSGKFSGASKHEVRKKISQRLREFAFVAKKTGEEDHKALVVAKKGDQGGESIGTQAALANNKEDEFEPLDPTTTTSLVQGYWPLLFPGFTSPGSWLQLPLPPITSTLPSIVSRTPLEPLGHNMTSSLDLDEDEQSWCDSAVVSLDEEEPDDAVNIRDIWSNGAV